MTDKEQFEYDFARVMVALSLRPNNWRYVHPGALVSNSDSCAIWLDEGYFTNTTRFCVDNRLWCEPFGLLSLLTPWKWKLNRKASKLLKYIMIGREEWLGL